MKCYWAIKQSKVSNTNPQKSKNSSASTKNSTTNGYNESAQWNIMKMVSHHKWCKQPNNTWQKLQQVTLGQLVLEDCSFNQEWPALVSWATLFKAKVGWEPCFFLWRKDVRAGYFITGVLILFTLLTTLSDRCLLIYYHGIPKTTLIFLSFNYQTITSVLVLYLSKLYIFFPHS